MTNINAIRFIIDDKESEDFSDSEIQYFLDQENSVNYAVYNLAMVLITKLRKQLLESDDTGAEQTKIASLRSRLDLLKTIYEDYKEKYEDEDDNTTGLYISSVKPTIAGGDV